MQPLSNDCAWRKILHLWYCVGVTASVDKHYQQSLSLVSWLILEFKKFGLWTERSIQFKNKFPLPATSFLVKSRAIFDCANESILGLARSVVLQIFAFGSSLVPSSGGRCIKET